MNSARQAVPALVLAAGIALTGCGGTHHGAEAQAAVSPKLQAFAVAGHWQKGMTRRPSDIILAGMSGFPQAFRLRWSRWTSKNGKATGRVNLFLGCKVWATCRPTVRNITVWANTPRTRKGLSFPYFTRMIYRFNNAKKGQGKAQLVSRNWRFGPNRPFWYGRPCSIGGRC